MTVATTMSTPQPRTISDRKLPTHPVKILIADDEHLVGSGVAANLKDLGYLPIGPAADGAEAVKLCEAMQPDIALLDLRMPKMDGLEAAEIIFQKMAIPVIIFSAFSDQEYIEAGTRVGVFGYLLKPVTQDQLRVNISVAWAKFLEFAASDQEIAQLKKRLEDRKFIEQAKWLLVDQKGITEPDAMKQLQRQARNHRRTLVDVARSLIENHELLNDT